MNAILPGRTEVGRTEAGHTQAEDLAGVVAVDRPQDVVGESDSVDLPATLAGC